MVLLATIHISAEKLRADVLYDIAADSSGYMDPTGILACIVLIFAIPFLIRSAISPEKRRTGNFIRLLMITAVPLIIAIFYIKNWINWASCQSLAKEGKYETVSGVIRDYSYYRRPGHHSESFKVAGATFECSDGDATRCGYKTNRIAGGIILKDGMRIVIRHRDGQILHIEEILHIKE